jgi:hypothetical protein
VRALVVAGLVALALAPVSSGAAANPCKLVTQNDAAKALGGKAGKGKLQTLGLYRSCTYVAGRRTLTVQTRQIDKTTFTKSAKANPKPVIEIPGIGDAAYSAGGGVALLVWKGGTEVKFLFVGMNPFVATQQSLAKTALGRL